MSIFLKNAFVGKFEKFVTASCFGLIGGGVLSVISSHVVKRSSEKHEHMKRFMFNQGIECNNIFPELMCPLYEVSISVPNFIPDSREIIKILASLLDIACYKYTLIEKEEDVPYNIIIAREIHDKVRDTISDLYMLLPAKKESKERVKENVQMLYSLNDQIYKNAVALVRYNKIK